ncbi:MAG: hypothetical protein WC436_01560 [Candidatus Babeliales bacterium]
MIKTNKKILQFLFIVISLTTINYANAVNLNSELNSLVNNEVRTFAAIPSFEDKITSITNIITQAISKIEAQKLEKLGPRNQFSLWEVFFNKIINIYIQNPDNNIANAANIDHLLGNLQNSINNLRAVLTRTARKKELDDLNLFELTLNNNLILATINLKIEELLRLNPHLVDLNAELFRVENRFQALLAQINPTKERFEQEIKTKIAAIQTLSQACNNLERILHQ